MNLLNDIKQLIFDVDMLKAAGAGVAMDNALDEVKEIADEVCPSVDEDGIYEYLVANQIIDPMPEK